jgi:hypothetical protein
LSWMDCNLPNLHAYRVDDKANESRIERKK